MAETTTTAPAQTSLRFVHGQRQGEELPLTQPSYRLGAGAGCEIALAGASVEAVHALLERVDAEAWQITDRSRIGVLVNGDKIEKTRLFDGDRIQIGNDHVLQVRVLLPTSKREPRPQTGAAKGGLLRSPWFYAGVGGFYLAFFALLYVVVTAADRDQGGALTPARAEDLLCRSEGYLSELAGRDAAGARPAGQARPAGDEPEDAVPCPTLRRLETDQAKSGLVVAPATCDGASGGLLARSGQAPAGEPEQWRDAALASLRQQLLDAWLLESQGRLREAEAAYSRVIDCFPDPKLPVTRYALERRQWIRDER